MSESTTTASAAASLLLARGVTFPLGECGDSSLLLGLLGGGVGDPLALYAEDLADPPTRTAPLVGLQTPR